MAFLQFSRPSLDSENGRCRFKNYNFLNSFQRPEEETIKKHIPPESLIKRISFPKVSLPTPRELLHFPIVANWLELVHISRLRLLVSKKSNDISILYLKHLALINYGLSSIAGKGIQIHWELWQLHGLKLTSHTVLCCLCSLVLLSLA